MKKFFVCSAIFTVMFLMIGCGGSESNGCADLYNCYKDCYADPYENAYCRDDCRAQASNADFTLYETLMQCKENWEEKKDYNETTKTEKELDHNAAGVRAHVRTHGGVF